MDKQIRDELLTHVDSEYKDFTSKLNPGRDEILGIRIPVLRDIAKKYAKLDWQNMLDEPDKFFEETMIRGMILGYAKLDVDEFLSRFADYIPLVNTWSLCDSVVMGCRHFRKDKEKSWQFIGKYLESGREFEVRVGLCILMNHLMPSDKEGKNIARKRNIDMLSLRDETENEGLFVSRTFEVLNGTFDQGYYAYMCAAWLLAEVFSVFPAHTMKFIEKNKMDAVSFNKGLQKIKESRIPDDEVKEYIETFKKTQ